MADGSLPVFVLACVECGKTVSGGEDKCPRCGVSFEALDFECPFCGEHVSAGQHTCDSCGTQFEIFAAEVADASVISLDSERESLAEERTEELEYECPSCGKAVGETDDKCPHCGASFTEQ